MWSIITSGVVSIVKGWFDALIKSKQKAEAEYNLRIAANESDWDLKAIEAAKYSWKDELITIVWFAPLNRCGGSIMNALWHGLSL